MPKKGTPFLLHSISLYVPYLVDLVLRFFIIRLIVARLGPEILGTWGIFQTVLLFPAFIQQSFSFAVFLHASRNREQSHIFLDGYFVSPILSILFGLLIVLFSSQLISFFRIPPEYFEMARLGFRLTAAVLVLGSISEMFMSLLQANRRFQLAGGMLLIASLINSSLDIVLLRTGHSILALITVDIGTYLLLCIGGAITSSSPMRQKFSFQMRPNAIRDLLKEVKTQLIIRSAAAVSWDLDSWIIPRFFGIQSMGSYWIARRIPYILKNMIWTGTTPTVPSMEGDIAENESKLQNIFWLQIYLFLPIAGFLWIFSENIIHVWIGDHSGNAPILMRILLLAVTMDVIPSTFFYFFLAKSKTKYTTRFPVYSSIVKLSITIAACLLRSIELLMFSTAAGALIFIFSMSAAVRKEINLSYRLLIQPLWGIAIGSTIAISTCLFLPAPHSILGIFYFTMIFAGIAYGLSLLIFRQFYPDIFSSLVSNFRGVVSRKINLKEGS